MGNETPLMKEKRWACVKKEILHLLRVMGTAKCWESLPGKAEKPYYFKLAIPWFKFWITKKLHLNLNFKLLAEISLWSSLAETWNLLDLFIIKFPPAIYFIYSRGIHLTLFCSQHLGSFQDQRSEGPEHVGYLFRPSKRDSTAMDFQEQITWRQD